MKKKWKVFLALMLVFVIALSASITVFAEVVYYYNGYLYVLINNEYVTLAGWEGSSTVLSVPDTINGRILVEVKNNAFSNNEYLTGVDFSNATNLERIGSYAFEGCISMEGNITIPETVSDIGTGAFQDCSLINGITFNSVISFIPNQCCNRCAALKNVTLSDSVTMIGSLAFANCPSMTYIEVPASVTSIANTAFQNSSNLTLGVYSNSYAHQYAEQSNIPYILLDAPMPPTEAPTESIPTEAPTEEPTVPATEAPTEVSVKYLGDVDGDGTVTSIDATLIQRHLCYIKTMISDEMLMLGDADGDGIISIIDVSFIMRHLATIEVPYPIGEPITNN